MKPLVSVITLAYYSEDIISTIDSVLKQDYENIELYVSDDGTKEFDCEHYLQYISSKGCLEKYQVVTRKKNVGTVKNINEAIKATNGEVIIFLSAGDMFYDKNVVSAWVDFFTSNDVKFATSYRKIYDENLEKSYGILPENSQVDLLKSANRKKIFMELTKGNFIFGCSTAVKRAFYEEFGLYNEDYMLIEDYPMVLKAVRCNVEIGFLDCITVKYRGGGISSPKQYNSKYKRDMELIYYNEIKPYVGNKFLASVRYNHWKLRQWNEKVFSQKVTMSKKRKIYFLLIVVRHPIKVFEKIVRILTKKK